jgi:hypothetical protein
MIKIPSRQIAPYISFKSKIVDRLIGKSSKTSSISITQMTFSIDLILLFTKLSCKLSQVIKSNCYDTYWATLEIEFSTQVVLKVGDMFDEILNFETCHKNTCLEKH